ncbi:MAG: DEAD/DEAH box helicase [Planctomycetaceae bacterium]
MSEGGDSHDTIIGTVQQNHYAMPIDFSRLNAATSADTLTHPRDIFSALPTKDRRYQYPRDVQTEVWDQFVRRSGTRDLVVKLNTGSGKTVVGLLMLKSCLNQQLAPAVYLAPNRYLVSQVLAEAQLLGVQATDDPDNFEFASGKSILVTTLHRLFNGLSIFGVGDQGIKQPIGSLVVDDAHACLEELSDQFRIAAGRETSLFEALLELYFDDLYQQSPSRAVEIREGVSTSIASVPFWAWQAKRQATLGVLAKRHKELRFNLPLLSQIMHLCTCLFSADGLEIVPPCLPVAIVPAYAAASRRIAMSATIGDETILRTDFDFDADALSNALIPRTAGDIGDRMIFIPEESDPNVSDEVLRDYFIGLSTSTNVVVIVPSGWRSEFWRPSATRVLTAENLEAGVTALRKSTSGLTVLINKYDGIDLPEDACRVLVIDGLPDTRSLAERHRQLVLGGSTDPIRSAVQRVEQGMGRGVRSNDDYCAVFLMGRGIARLLLAQRGIEFFSPATRAQFDLSRNLAKQLHGKGLSAISEALDLFLKRDKDWLTASKGMLSGLAYNSIQVSGTTADLRRTAFNAAVSGEIVEAVKAMQAAVNAEDERHLKGLLRQEMAAYQNQVSAPDAQLTQRAAHRENNWLVKPLAGVDYTRIGLSDTNQAANCLRRVREQYRDSVSLVVATNDLLSMLIYSDSASSERFEQALDDLAAC